MRPAPTSAAPGETAFAARDWAMLVGAALMWGSSFLFIKVALEDYPPATIAWLRVLLGVAVLSLLPAARRPLRQPGDLRGVGALGVLWMAAPFVLFTTAQQHIPSALAGMINGAAPLFATAVAILWLHQRPGGRTLLGLAVGFVGVVAIGLPNVDSGATLTGVLLVLLATFCYGIAYNIAAPLQRRNGSLPVVLRALLVALVLLTPFGVWGLAGATPSLTGTLAVLALGALGTGAAYVLFTTLAGRVGAPRASIANYFIPVVAILLGAGLLGERVAWLSLAGIALVLVGARLATSARATEG